jgi:catechol 2,3-dioxygenase-like lactoylglutathione lyase family enzyme
VLGNCDIGAFVATANADKARDFYENTLGLKFVADEEYALIFDANGTTLRVQKAGPFTPHPFTSLGWHVRDIEAAMKELREKGVVFEQYPFMPDDSNEIMTFPNGARVAWFKDPDGNLLSLAQH